MTMDHSYRALSPIKSTKTLVFLFFVFLFSVTKGQTKFYDQPNVKSLQKDCHSLDSLVEIGQIKTALDLAIPLKEKTILQNQPGFYFKVLCQMINLQENENDSSTLSILNNEVKVNKGEFKALAHLVYAKWLSNKYPRWISEDRVYDNSSNIVSDWNPATIRDLVNEHVISALLSSDGIPYKDEFTPLIMGQDNIQSFDFKVNLKCLIAEQSISIVDQVYLNEEGGIASFDTSSLFTDRLAFLNIDPLKSNYDDLLKKQIYLYQILAQENQMIFELNRYKNFYQTYPCSAYEKSLNRLLDSYKDQEQSIFIIQALSQYYNSGNKIKSMELLETGIRKFGRSKYINVLLYEKNKLLERSVYVHTENIYPIKKENRIAGKKILIQVNQQNCDTLNFYVLKYDPVRFEMAVHASEMIKYINMKEMIYEQMDQMELVYSVTKKFEHTEDLIEHSYDVALPGLDEGNYILVVSDSSLVNQNSLFVWNEFLVTDKFMKSTISKNGKTMITVVSAIDGHPMAKEKFQLYAIKDQKFDHVFTAQTNKNGMCEINLDISEYYNKILLFEKSNVAMKLENDNWYDGYEDIKGIKSEILTDRQIYRPGQKLYFKSILFDEKDMKPIAGLPLRIEFQSNGVKIGEMEMNTNQFGSISGEFILPGSMDADLSIDIYNSDMILGSEIIKVEEYKRPGFEVNMNTPKDEYKLNQDVKLEGEAITFAGIPVSNANVSYTVLRSNVFNYKYFYGYGHGPDQILSGKCKTDENGKFFIQFNLLAPPKSSGNYQVQSFVFEIKANVTDLNGEVIGGSVIFVAGYSSQVLNMYTGRSSYSNLSDVNIMHSVENFSGEKQLFNGSISIYKIDNTQDLKKKILWGETSEYSTLSEQDKLDLVDYKLGEQEEKLSLVVNKVYQNDTGSNTIFESRYFEKPGRYKAVMFHVVSPGDTIRSEAEFKVFPVTQFDNNRYEILSVNHLNNIKLEPGSKARFVVRTADKNKTVRVYVSSHRGVILDKYFVLKKGFKVFEIPVKNEDRGNIEVQVITTDKHREINDFLTFIVPYSNKELKIEVQTIRRLTEPGSHEKIVLKLSGPASEKAAMEMCAVLYDASLDEIYENQGWNLYLYHDYYSYNYSAFNQVLRYSDMIYPNQESYQWSMINYPQIDFSGILGRNYYWFNDEAIYHSYTRSGNKLEETMEKVSYDVAPAAAPAEMANEPASQPVHLRKNFNETAFFMPQLYPNSNGEIVLEFDMPETIGKWRFMALAHSMTMQTGYIEDYIQTSKKLIVQPNLPRFIRQKDKVSISAKVQNESDNEQVVTVKMRLKNEDDNTPQYWVGGDSTKTIKLAPFSNASVSFNLNVPDFNGIISCAVIAYSGTYSDGMIQNIPVVSNRTLVYASMPISVRDAGKQNLEFKALLNSSSKSLVTRQLSIDMCNRPAWYAVLSLPYLMESDDSRIDQLFSRFYAYNLAYYLAQKDENVKLVYEQWRSKGKIKSKLNINEDLKSVLLSETPWVLEARSEEERMNRLGELFDMSLMEEKIKEDYQKLSKLQRSGGGFSWFKGMQEDPYMTENIVIGFGKLKSIGIDVKPYMDLIGSAIRFLDQRMEREYPYQSKFPYSVNRESVHYLYGKSFFPQIGKQISDSLIIRLLSFSEKNWNHLSLYSKAHLAVAVHRLKPESKLPELILRAFNENAKRDKTLGMYWVNTQLYWQWDMSNIETHTAIMEVYSMLSKDSSAYSDQQVWLLRNKQANSWNSTISTADACYALLNKGQWLNNDQDVKVTVNGKIVNPPTVEAGTGYWRADIPAGEVNAQSGKIGIESRTSDLAYGGVYWQYFEDMDKIFPNSAGLAIQRRYFVERIVNGKTVKVELKPGDTLKIGEIVNVVLFVSADRPMEYLHIKDLRPGSAEPLEALAAYKYQSGIGYYQNPNDISMNFYIDYMPKGKYQLNYSFSIQQAGVFDCGIASIENLYAPEFSANSQGFKIFVIE